MKRSMLVLLLALVLCIPATAAQAAMRLSYATFFPPTHAQAQLAEAWCKDVERVTNGEVTVDFFPGQTLVKAPQLYDAVVEGIADVSFGVLGYHRGRFPVMAALDLPLGYTSGVQATKIANDVYAKFKPKEFNDVQVMYFNAHGPGLPHTKGKPIRTLEDWKGMKMRATGNSAKVVAALGGTPVAGSMAEALQAIQKGVVDGGMYPIETNKGWNMAEVVDYMMEAFPIAYTTTFYVVMNKDKWEALSSEAQAAIAKLNQEYADKHGQAWVDSDVVGKAYFLEQGNEIISIDPAEAERWKQAVRPVIDEYVADSAKLGFDGKAVVESIEAGLAGN
jgi:TRAP-type C4-dicarboxylate transport system substrate-binding protein